ncbi:MAG: hypothetical protein WCJ24_01080 [Candidatus Saccharibacteria bacterium]
MSMFLEEQGRADFQSDFGAVTGKDSTECVEVFDDWAGLAVDPTSHQFVEQHLTLAALMDVDRMGPTIDVRVGDIACRVLVASAA